MKRQDFDKIRSKINQIISNEDISYLIKTNDSLKTIVEEYNTALMELEMQSDELNKTQIHLETEKQKYKDLFFNSPVAFVVIDVNGKVIDINSEARKLLDLGDLDNSNNPFLTNLVTVDLPRFYNHINEVLISTGTIKEEFNFEIKNKKQHKRIEFNSIKYLDSIKDKTYIRIVLVDITERYELQSYTNELHQQLNSMLMSGNMAWWRMNVKTMKAEYHSLKAEILGYTPEELSDDVMQIMSFLHPDDYQSTWDAMLHHLEGSSPLYEIVYRMLCKDGKYKWILDRGKIAKYDEYGKPEIVIGIFTDITQLKEIELLLKQEKDRLIYANEAKTKLVSILSHDLRSPYATIINYLELLNERFDIFDDSKKKEIIRIVYETSKSSLHLLENILEWARSDSELIKVNKVAVEINGYIRQQLDVFENSAKLKNITFQVTGEKNLKLNTDLNLFSTIIRNLLSNAVKFSHKNSTIYIDYNKIDNNVVFSVRDNGIGMNEKQINNLFSITNTSSRIGTDGERGTGFGLKIVKEYISHLKGKIWVSSEVNLGTTFYFSLPIE